MSFNLKLSLVRINLHTFKKFYICTIAAAVINLKKLSRFTRQTILAISYFSIVKIKKKSIFFCYRK